MVRLGMLGLCWCGFYFAAISATAQTLHTTTEIHSQAQLVKLEPNTLWTFRIADNERPIDSAQLVRWGSWTGVRHQSAVWLRDGSWLCGDVQIARTMVSITNDWLKTPEFPVEELRGIVFAPPTSLPRWLELQSQMEAVVGEQDVLWLSGGQRLSGVVRWSSVEAGATNQSIQVDSAGQSVEVPVDSVEAVVFSPALLGPVPSHQNTIQLGLVDGSLIYVSQMEPRTSSVQLRLAGGIELASFDGPRQFCRGLVYLVGTASQEPHSGIQYLSALPVGSYRHVGNSSLTWQLGINRDVYGRPMHSSQAIYARGLATHSSCQVAYRWDGSPARLMAEVIFAAPPAQANRGLGSVQCQVLLARSGALEAVERFELVRSESSNKNSSRLVDIDVSQSKLIVLVTEQGSYGQYGDHVLWLDARIAQPASGAPPD